MSLCWPLRASRASSISQLALRQDLSYRRKTSRRCFHATTRRPFVTEVISQTRTCLETCHSLSGLPWVYVIPLAAVCVRLGLLLPSRLQLHRIEQRREDLKPVIFAWAWRLKDDIRRDSKISTPNQAQKELKQQLEKKQSEIYARNRCGQLRLFAPMVLSLPVWLVLTEALRNMCGTQQGLLGLLTTWYTDANLAVEPARQEDSALSDAPEIYDDQFSIVEQPITTTAETLQTVSEGLDTEGALWFTNLLLPDSSGYLSGALSLLYLTQMVDWRVITARASKIEVTLLQKRLNRALICVGLAIFPVTLHVPAAMMVYWISSLASAVLLARVFKLALPIRRAKVPRWVASTQLRHRG